MLVTLPVAGNNGSGSGSATPMNGSDSKRRAACAGCLVADGAEDAAGDGFLRAVVPAAGVDDGEVAGEAARALEGEGEGDT